MRRPVVIVWEIGSELQGVYTQLTRYQDHAVFTALQNAGVKTLMSYHTSPRNAFPSLIFLPRARQEGLSFGIDEVTIPNKAYAVFWKQDIRHGTRIQGETVFLTENELQGLAESAFSRFGNFLAIPLEEPASFKEIKEGLEDLGASIPAFREDPRAWEPE